MLKISILTLLCMVTLHAQAQIPTDLDGLTLKADRENPQPGENVTITLESFSFDLSAASIVWIVNGKTHTQGVGMKKITVTAGKIGVPGILSAIVKTTEGREVQKSLTLKSGSVDIIWETRGYTPPFFKGKLPLSYQNSVHVVAIPHLSNDGVNEIDPKTLVYSWKRDGKYVTDGQGYGKQSIDIQLDMIPKPLSLEVEVYTREKTQNITVPVTIEPSNPSVLFYEESSLYGTLFNKILTGKVPLKNEEMRIRAVPYGFNINPKSDSNTYAWSINNSEQPDLLKNQSITIRPKADTEGSSKISLEIRNQSAILQGARGEFTVYFSKKSAREEEQNVTF